MTPRERSGTPCTIAARRWSLRPRTPAGVAAAIAYARAQDLVIAVRCGGHSMPGHSVCDGGVVIDLRAINRVRVDAAARGAQRSAAARCSARSTARRRQHGLVVPAGVVSHTGAGGLTLGGGVGRLMRRFGLTIDSLLSAEVVTADGEVAARVGRRARRPVLGAARRRRQLRRRHRVRVRAARALRARDPRDVPSARTGARGARARPPGDGRRGRTSCCGRASCAARRTCRGCRRSSSAGAGHVADRVVGRHRRAGTARARGLRRRARRRSPATCRRRAVPDDPDDHRRDASPTACARYIKAGFTDELSDGLIDALIERGAAIGSPITQIEVLAMGGAIAPRGSRRDRVPVPRRAAG